MFMFLSLSVRYFVVFFVIASVNQGSFTRGLVEGPYKRNYQEKEENWGFYLMAAYIYQNVQFLNIYDLLYVSYTSTCSKKVGLL